MYDTAGFNNSLDYARNHEPFAVMVAKLLGSLVPRTSESCASATKRQTLFNASNPAAYGLHFVGCIAVDFVGDSKRRNLTECINRTSANAGELNLGPVTLDETGGVFVI